MRSLHKLILLTDDMENCNLGDAVLLFDTKLFDFAISNRHGLTALSYWHNFFISDKFYCNFFLELDTSPRQMSAPWLRLDWV